MQMHPVFHVSLLEHAANDPSPGQRQPPSPPIEADGEDEYVDDILDSRRVAVGRSNQIGKVQSGAERELEAQAKGSEQILKEHGL